MNNRDWDDERVVRLHTEWHREPRRDHPHPYCRCATPDVRPVTLFGVAMGGMQECGRCLMPVAESESTNPRGAVPTMLWALTTGQRLVFAICAAVFVFTFIVWPVIRPRSRRRQFDDMRAWQRYMREIRRHDER